MRIVVFNNMITPYTTRLYNWLLDSGVDIAVVSCTAVESNRSWGNFTTRFEHVVLPGWNVRLGPGRFAYINRDIFRTFDRLKPDVLVINGFYPSMLAGYAWARSRRKALALTIDGWAETMPNSILHRTVRPIVLRRCGAVAVCGKKGRAYFEAAGVPGSSVFEVPLIPAWDPPSEVPDLAGRPWDLLWVAHLNNEAKNLGFFLDVVERIARQRSGLRIRLIGSGPMEQEALARLQSLPITFQHDRSLAWDQMAEVFLAAKLLLFPSRWEPWGLVANEAMQCATPVIASTHVGAGDDLILTNSNGAILPLDEDAWCRTIGEVLDDPTKWNRWSQSARSTALARTLAASSAQFEAMARHACGQFGS